MKIAFTLNFDVKTLAFFKRSNKRLFVVIQLQENKLKHGARVAKDLVTARELNQLASS